MGCLQVIFYLDELKEVSEQTGDRVKYVGQHSVKGRVKLLKVLNPSVAATRETYLKAEVEELTDTDADEDATTAEEELRTLFHELVDVQAALGEEPRFTEAVKETLQFGRGSGDEDKGLWGTVVLWQQFLDQLEASTQMSLLIRKSGQQVKSQRFLVPGTDFTV